MNRFEENKKFLKRYRLYSRQIKRLEDQLYELSNHIESTKSVEISGIPSNPNGLPYELSNDINKRDELDERINELVIESKPIKAEILKSIDHLENPKQSRILEMFFIDDVPLDLIAYQLKYSMRNTTRLYSQGVINIWH